MATEITGILETPVYVDDLSLSYDFYHGLLGLERMIEGDRIHAYDVAPGQVLIVCLRGASARDAQINGQRVPGHSSQGPLHFAFKIEKEALPDWIEKLQQEGLEIESQVTWPLGGQSIYIRDPFNNVVELATAGIWPNDPINK